MTEDPIGIEGGINRFTYVAADPVNSADPSGEILPHAAAFAGCMVACMLTDAASNAITGECNNWGDSAKNCAMGCAAGMGIGAAAGAAGKWGKKVWDWMKNRPCPINSFTSDTLVHVRPPDASDEDAKQGKAILKPIGELKVGDQVLAWAEWKKPEEAQSYERITEVFASHRQQRLVHITLEDGNVITATDGHPFHTSEGWRDAILLKNGDKLDLSKTPSGQGVSLREALVEKVRIETKVVPVFNLEVANAHTFYVGTEGALVHNARCNIGVQHSTRKRAKEAAAHPHPGKKLPQPKKDAPKQKRDAYEERQKYKDPERHPDSDYPDSHYHDRNKSRSNVNVHHYW